MTLDAPTVPAVAFRHALRVYWEDTDAAGVVFYANYLKYFERARTEWLRALGIEQQSLRERTGVVFIVTSTQVHYRSPARLDDWIEATVALKSAGRATLALTQQAWRSSTLLAEGDIRIGCVDVASFKPRRIPAEVMERIG
jgi:acyl-CoA thioester hydrolase